MNHIEIPKVDYDLMVEEIERLRQNVKELEDKIMSLTESMNNLSYLDYLRRQLIEENY